MATKHLETKYNNQNLFNVKIIIVYHLTIEQNNLKYFL